ncbi:MAG: Crp/Fnr family transcriptional regulator [Bdellovibrionales bacterium]
MNENSLIYKTLSDTPLFKGQDSSFLSRMAESAVTLRCEKGKVLFVHDEQAERFYVIRHGWIKLFRETLDGAQAVIDITTTGDTFGETALFQNNLYPYSAEAVESSEVISLPLHLLNTEIDTNPQFTKSFLFSIAKEKDRQDKEIEHASIQNAPQRICCFLLRLTDQSNKGKTIIHLPYDKMFIAAKLGMQAETFSRALKKLKTDTGIRVKGSSIEVDNVEQLSNYACQACSFEFPCKDIKRKAS